MDRKFIQTSDKETAEKLIKLGFNQIYSDGTNYVFINDTSKQTFENKKTVYTNNLCI